MLQKLFLAVCLFISCAAFAQYNPSIDVQHYEFHLKLNDATDSIEGHALITVRFTQKIKQAVFDLVNINNAGKGMMTTFVAFNNKMVAFLHQNNKIEIPLQKETREGETGTFIIYYKGIPADGLIISKNKFGHRTIFADNWPNRARNWIPCKDHLSDKASVEFIITAPDHFKVISNGIKTEDKDISNHLHLTHWKEDAPIATKIMVIGVADFAVDYPGNVDGIPVSSWIFPEQKEKGFYDYAQALDILPFYIKNIGPYSYKKLANVQSKTIFGGMENAGAIFYSENSITGTRKSEGLLAHEIAHQWFGDAATETDWPHLWLSEGFATEMTNLYFENKYGRDTLVKQLQKDRKAVIDFVKKKKLPVIDTTESGNLMQLLNINSYQKGGWVLHMLRNQLGDAVFWKSIRAYYAAYQNKNASTTDLEKIFEQVSGKDLHTFFTQWLYTPENPTIEYSWSYDESSKKLIVDINQRTTQVFVFPIEFGVMFVEGTKAAQTVNVTQKQNHFSIPLENRPSRVILDPNCNLLFEAIAVSR